MEGGNFGTEGNWRIKEGVLRKHCQLEDSLDITEMSNSAIPSFFLPAQVPPEVKIGE
jgi:hypothetical protein